MPVEAPAAPAPAPATGEVPTPAVQPETPTPAAPAPAPAPPAKPKEGTLLGTGEKSPAPASPAALPAEIDYSKLTTPKDSPFVTAEDLKRISEEAKGGKLTLEQAQSLVNREHAVGERLLAIGQARLKAQSKGWEDALKAHPQMGGANLPQTDSIVTKACVTLFGKDFLDEVVRMGYQFHPKFVEGLFKYGKAMQEPSVPKGNPPQGNDRSNLAPHERMYGPDSEYVAEVGAGRKG